MAKLATTGGLSSFGAGTIVNIASGATWFVGVTPPQAGVTVNIFGTGNTENLGALRTDVGTIASTSSIILKANGSIGGNVATNTGTINAVISENGGSFSLTKQGAATTVLGNANTYSGATVVAAGTLTLANSLALQNSALDTTSSVAGTTAVGLKTTVTTLTLGGLIGNKNLSAVFRTDATGGPAGTTALGGYSGVTALTLNPGTGQTPSYSAVIANGAAGMTLTKTGLGTQTLTSTTSSFTGNITISGGTLVAGAGLNSVNPVTSPLGNPQTAARQITVGSGATLNFGGNDTLGNASSTPVVTVVNNGGTIRNNGNFFATFGPLQLNGGTLTSFGGANASFPSFLFNGTVTVGGSAVSTISGSGTFSQMVLATAGTTFDVADAASGSASDLDVSVALQGGALTKSGLGTMTLSGANTFTGNVTVTGGTLTLSNAPDPLNANPGNDASTVTIAASGATLNLTYSGTDIVDKLFIGTTQMPAGVYGAGSPAIPQITGTGTLTVLTGPAGFASWITGTFTNGNVPLGKQGPNDDPDNDGIPNLVEYAIFGQDPTVNNTAIGTFTANTLSFTKRPATTGLTYAIVQSTDLGVLVPWSEVPTGPTYTNNATTISYTLTPGTPVKNFVRLKVTQAP